jgi:hypothetical protein
MLTAEPGKLRTFAAHSPPTDQLIDQPQDQTDPAGHPLPFEQLPDPDHPFIQIKPIFR